MCGVTQCVCSPYRQEDGALRKSMLRVQLSSDTELNFHYNRYDATVLC